MPLVWTQALSVGVKEIDAQHRELFKRINHLLDAMSLGKGKEEVQKLLAFLEEYVVLHFHTEQSYMARNFYPGYRAHRKEHLAFTRDFQDIQRDLEGKGVNSVLVIAVQQRICDWWHEHVKKTDKAFGNYLASTSPRP